MDALRSASSCAAARAPEVVSWIASDGQAPSSEPSPRPDAASLHLATARRFRSKHPQGRRAAPLRRRGNRPTQRSSHFRCAAPARRRCTRHPPHLRSDAIELFGARARAPTIPLETQTGALARTRSGLYAPRRNYTNALALLRPAVARRRYPAPRSARRRSRWPARSRRSCQAPGPGDLLGLGGRRARLRGADIKGYDNDQALRGDRLDGPEGHALGRRVARSSRRRSAFEKHEQNDGTPLTADILKYHVIEGKVTQGSISGNQKCLGGELGYRRFARKTWLDDAIIGLKSEGPSKSSNWPSDVELLERPHPGRRHGARPGPLRPRRRRRTRTKRAPRHVVLVPRRALPQSGAARHLICV